MLRCFSFWSVGRDHDILFLIAGCGIIYLQIFIFMHNWKNHSLRMWLRVWTNTMEDTIYSRSICLEMIRLAQKMRGKCYLKLVEVGAIESGKDWFKKAVIHFLFEALWPRFCIQSGETIPDLMLDDLFLLNLKLTRSESGKMVDNHWRYISNILAYLAVSENNKLMRHLSCILYCQIGTME